MFSLAGHCQIEERLLLDSLPHHFGSRWIFSVSLFLFILFFTFFYLVVVVVLCMRCMYSALPFSHDSLFCAILCLSLSHLASLDSGYVLRRREETRNKTKQKIPIGGNQPLNDNLVDIYSWLRRT